MSSAAPPKPAPPKGRQSRGNVHGSVHKSGAIDVRVRGRNADIILKPEDVKDWDEEELRKGYRKDKNGRFSGRPPAIVPTVVHAELVRRVMSEVRQSSFVELPAVMTKLRDVILDPSPLADTKAIVAAIRLYLEYTIGKAPNRVELNVTTPKFLDVISGGIVPGDDDEDIIDAELIEEDPD